MSTPITQAVGLYVYPVGTGSSEEWMCLSAERYCQDRAIPFDAFEIARTEKGKPYFVNTPVLYVSLSHSGSYCIVAIAPCQVGVDLQTHHRLPTDLDETQRYWKLSRRYFHPAEHAYVQSDPVGRFFPIWTAKESYAKYTGTGLDSQFSVWSILPEDTAQLHSWQAQGVHFQAIDFREGYSLCLCTELPLTHQLYCE